MTAVRLPLLLSAGLLAAPLIGAAQPATAAPKAAGPKAAGPKAAGPKAAACVKVPSDFNGDGYADLAAGASSSTSSGSDAAPDGAVHVLYGSSAGLGQGTRTAQFFATSSTGLPAGRFDGG
ncbi:MAG: hypothetical protein ACJ786_20125, partial [Catenulispora sp.]